MRSWKAASTSSHIVRFGLYLIGNEELLQTLSEEWRSQIRLCVTAVPLCEIHAVVDAEPKQGSGKREETLRDIHKIGLLFDEQSYVRCEEIPSFECFWYYNVDNQTLLFSFFSLILMVPGSKVWLSWLAIPCLNSEERQQRKKYGNGMTLLCSRPRPRTYKKQSISNKSTEAEY